MRVKVYRIDKGVEIPGLEKNKWVSLAKKMGVGDSVLFKINDNGKSSLGIALVRMYGKGAQRIYSEDSHSRVWRIK